jgi:hypothetical protein
LQKLQERAMCAGLQGGASYQSDSAYQDVFIPTGSLATNFTFLVRVETTDSRLTPADDLSVDIQDLNGTQLEPVTTIDNTFFGVANPAGYTVRGAYDSSAYRGRWIRVRFASSNSKLYPTTFEIDDASLE